jgi:hypothetical protein
MFQVKQDWKTEIKNYILMGFNAEGIKEENALKQVEIIWDCIEPIIERLLRQEREKQYEEMVKILEKILGYCGIWHEDDIISVERKIGYGVSMTIRTFLELLKEEMVKNKKRSPKIIKEYEKRKNNSLSYSRSIKKNWRNFI